MSGSLSIGFTPGYPGIHGDDFAVTLFLNPVSDNLSISGPTAIAIPYENTFAYSCVGGTIDTDSSLPNGFHFDTGTNTLTYSGVQPSTDGIIKLKSTSFSGEKHDGLIVHYYPISSIQDNNCLFLKPDGSTTSIQMTVNTDNCVDIPIPPAIQDPLIRNSVRVIFGNINLIFSDIWDDFLSGFTSLQKIYFPTQFNQVTRIRSNFLSNDSSLESIDFSNLSQVTEILDGFCNNLASLSYIDLSPFNNVDYVGSMFLSGAKSLKYVDFSN
jgi:hypothetical protein